MVHHQPLFPGDVLAAKSQMYAMHLERMLNPVMKVRERGLTLTELGVVLVTLVPVTLAMRFVTASQDGLEKAFAPVLKAMRGVEVVYTRTRRWIALKGYLKGKKVARVAVVEARKTARTKKEESREISPMAEEMDKAEEKQPIAAKGTENLPAALNKRRGEIVMEQENMENENKAKSLGEKTNNSEVGQNKKKKKRKNKNKGEKQEN